MPFEPGKTGNTKGRPPDALSMRSLKERLHDMGYDALDMLVEIARAGNSEKHRLQARETIFCRIYPALRSIEISGEVESKYILNVLLDGKKHEAENG